MKWTALKSLAILFLLLPSLVSAADQGQVVQLWPQGIPGAEAATSPEGFSPSTAILPSHFDVVHNPAVYIFLPPREKANGMAVIVVPGGGHSWLNMANAWPIATWLNQQGIAAFVLKYPLAKARDSHYSIMGDEQPDTFRAIRVVRSRAREWNVSPSTVGAMGLSAGGELAALAETRFDAGDPSSSDPVAALAHGRISPSFSIQARTATPSPVSPAIRRRPFWGAPTTTARMPPPQRSCICGCTSRAFRLRSMSTRGAGTTSP
jgi:acetyl esterase/lipase